MTSLLILLALLVKVLFCQVGSVKRVQCYSCWSQAGSVFQVYLITIFLVAQICHLTIDLISIVSKSAL